MILLRISSGLTGVIAVEFDPTYFRSVVKMVRLGSLSIGLICLCLTAEVYGSDWPGPLIWNVGSSVQRKTNTDLQHKGSIRVASDFREVVLNQVKKFERSKTVTWSYTRRISRVKKGVSSKDRVTIDSWEWLEQDGLPDTSLAKYAFDFVGADRGRSRRLVQKGSDPLSKNAKKWVERNLRSVDEPLFLATWPSKKVARIGDEWEVDPLRLAISLNLDELSRINVTKSSAKAKLVSLRMVEDVTWGKYEVDSVFTLGQLPDTNATWRKGGQLKLRIAVDGPMEPGLYGPYVIKIFGELSGEGLIRGISGEEILREIRMTLEGEWTRSTR